MTKKYKCLSCGHKFEADKERQVICPACHSNNVKLDSISPILKVAVAVLVCVIVGILAGIVLKQRCPNCDKRMIPWIEHQCDSIITPLDSNNIVTMQNICPKCGAVIEPGEEHKCTEDKTRLYLENKEPVVQNDKKYSLKAWCAPTGVNAIFKLYKDRDCKHLIATSDVNGLFKDIEPSKNTVNSYFLLVEADTTQYILPEEQPKEVTGFKPILNVTKCMTTQELQAMINSRSSALRGDNPKIASKVTFRVANLEKDDGAILSFQDIFNMLKLEIWTSVIVTSVGCDEFGRLNAVGLKVEHNN